LYVYEVQPKAILLNNSVDSAISATANCLTRIATGPAVTHGDKEVDNELLEKGRWRCLYTFKEVFSESFPELLITGFQQFVG